MFRVFIKSRAEKEFAKLSKDLKQRFYEEFEKLTTNPFLHPNVKKIKGTKIGYRLRVGRWRVLFVLFREQKQIEIIDIFMEKGEENYKKRMGLFKGIEPRWR